MTDRVPVKGNCVASGPSMWWQKLYRDCFLVIRPITVCKILLYCRMQNITILWVSTFLVELGIPPAGGPQMFQLS